MGPQPRHLRERGESQVAQVGPGRASRGRADGLWWPSLCEVLCARPQGEGMGMGQGRRRGGLAGSPAGHSDPALQGIAETLAWPRSSGPGQWWPGGQSSQPSRDDAPGSVRKVPGGQRKAPRLPGHQWPGGHRWPSREERPAAKAAGRESGLPGLSPQSPRHPAWSQHRTWGRAEVPGGAGTALRPTPASFCGQVGVLRAGLGGRPASGAVVAGRAGAGNRVPCRAEAVLPLRPAPPRGPPVPSRDSARPGCLTGCAPVPGGARPAVLLLLGPRGGCHGVRRARGGLPAALWAVET